MNDIKILAQGNFTSEDLLVSVSESNRKVDPLVESKLEKVWEEKLKFAKEHGKNIYNGDLYRLNVLEIKDAKLLLDFGNIDYKTASCLKSIPEHLNFGTDYHGNLCFTSAAIKTLDEKYLLVEMSGKSMNPNKVDFVGGLMETNIEMKNGKSIFDSLFLEMNEEVGLIEDDILLENLRCVFRTKHAGICFYFLVNLSVSSEEIKTRFKKNEDEDIKSLLFLEKDEYLNFFVDEDVSTKKFIANLL